MSKIIFIPKDLTGQPGTIIDSASGVILNTNNLDPITSDSGVILDGLTFLVYRPWQFNFGSTSAPSVWQWDGVTTFTATGVVLSKIFGQTDRIRKVGANVWVCGHEGGGSSGTPYTLYKFQSSTGAFLLTKGPLPVLVNGVTAFSIDDSETVIYYSNGLFNGPIKSFNLSTNVAGPDVITNIGSNSIVNELWSIPASTDFIAVIVTYDGSNPTTYRARRYTSAGAVVYDKLVMNDTLISGDITSESGYDPDFVSLWIRTPGPPSFDIRFDNQFTRMRLSDGFFISSCNTAVVAGCPPTTCPLLILETATPPPLPNAGSGLYKVVPGKRNDTIWFQDFSGSFDTKIPNPFAKSALIGE